MRAKKFSWFTYLQGVAIVVVILFTVQHLNPSPVEQEVPRVSTSVPVEISLSSTVDHKRSEPVSLKGEQGEQGGDDFVQPRLVAERQDLVAWITGIATHQELDALKLLRSTLSLGRDALTITRQVQKLRPDGWMFCVQEGEICHCEGQTRYGDFELDQWVEKKDFKSPILCHHSQYGLKPEQDFSPGKLKYCQCRAPTPKCPNGQPFRAENCPDSKKACRAGCLSRMPKTMSSVTPQRAKLCSKSEPNELLWACDSKKSLKPRKGHSHNDAEDLLERGMARICEDPQLVPEVEVWLECDFVSQWLRWTTAASPWIEEAYVTYVGGPKDSNYEWQATNLIRSIDLFSSRPLVIVIFGDQFVPPLSWQSMRNVIAYRMRPISRGVSFNFNKVRSILASRVMVGIQLDTDQLIFKGMDQVFEGTRREVGEFYPWPILPVHWMSRDDTPGNPYAHYAFKGWDGPQSMRWCHAHPTWTHFALPWFGDLLHERMLAATGRKTSTLVFDLEQVRETGISVVALVRKGDKAKVKRHVEMSNAMWEDEDMMNVNLWRHKVNNSWCKFDLEPNLFLLRRSLDKRMYFDPKWYPDGMPVLFLSIHNTKNFDPADLLLRLMELCQNGVEDLECPAKDSEFMMPICRAGVQQERELRMSIQDYAAKACCCLEPRWSHPVFWSGHWYESLREVPDRARDGGARRKCLIP
ncbi:folE [Symbiodinium natans]|uniref:FolE protein n=1 Tax=Symbiodinium natans TaxID=878477 RepID=A0A812K3X9_9DINO|nr:folE [Symbiodinium natans]